MPKYFGERLALCIIIFASVYTFLSFSNNPGDPFRSEFNTPQIISMILVIVCILLLAAMED